MMICVSPRTTNSSDWLVLLFFLLLLLLIGKKQNTVCGKSAVDIRCPSIVIIGSVYQSFDSNSSDTRRRKWRSIIGFVSCLWKLHHWTPMRNQSMSLTKQREKIPKRIFARVPCGDEWPSLIFSRFSICFTFEEKTKANSFVLSDFPHRSKFNSFRNEKQIRCFIGKRFLSFIHLLFHDYRQRHWQ